MSAALIFKMISATFMALFTAIGGIFVPVEKKEVCMIAHRGYSGIYHENTGLAFEKAAKHGSGGAETDVRITSDGVFVCSHNSSVELKDGTELEISEHTYSELSAQQLKHKKIGNVYICTFKEYLEIMKANNMVCFIELKGEWEDEDIKAVFDMCAEVYDLQKCIMQSFSFDNLVKARKIVPDLPLMLTWDAGSGDYKDCFKYGFSIDALYEDVTPEMVEEFHSNNLEFAVWTANTVFEVEYCKSLGVDYIESDLL